MVIKVSYESSESTFNFSDLSSVLKVVESSSNHVQIRIHIGNIHVDELVQQHHDVESRLNGPVYLHYVCVTLSGETSLVTFQLANLLKILCELFDYEIELFAKCVD